MKIFVLATLLFIPTLTSAQIQPDACKNDNVICEGSFLETPAVPGVATQDCDNDNGVCILFLHNNTYVPQLNGELISHTFAVYDGADVYGDPSLICEVKYVSDAATKVSNCTLQNGHTIAQVMNAMLQVEFDRHVQEVKDREKLTKTYVDAFMQLRIAIAKAAQHIKKPHTVTESISFPPAPVPGQHNYTYAAQLTNYREDVWQEFLYIRTHHGLTPAKSKLTEERWRALVRSIPVSYDYFWEIVEAAHIAHCERNTIGAMLYYSSFNEGDEPAADAKKCRYPHTEETLRKPLK